MKEMMKAITGICLGFTLTVVTAGSALALGLGNAVGQAILGAPLQIEISLIGSEAGIPALDCFNLRSPQTEIASTYVLRNAQLQVLGEPGRARLVVSSSSPVQEPVVEFAVAVGCGFGLSRDYLLLAEEPGRIASPVLPTLQPAATILEATTILPPQTKQAVAKPPAPPPGENLLRIASAHSLSALARQNYPLQPKAREKFVRMMLAANPYLKSGETLIDSDTEFRMPPGLPLRRQGSRPPGGQSTANDSAASRPHVLPLQTAVAEKLAGSVSKSRQDHLVVGAAAERNRNPAELLAEAERLAAILSEQTQAQDAVAERIGKLDNTINELKKQYIGLTDRLNRIEAERQAEKLASKPASLDFIELLLAVLAGGLMGALSLYLVNRRQLQRGAGTTPATSAAPLITPRAAQPASPPNELMDFNLPLARESDATLQVSQEHGTGTPAANIPASQNLAPEAQHDFDFSSTAPPGSNDQVERVAETIKKVSP
ncbi:MAG: hypothetical protein NT159_09050 [Proteobacteria bacterium]|nr:hypothetical protein [Pseudomonadota bacterium]